MKTFKLRDYIIVVFIMSVYIGLYVFLTNEEQKIINRCNEYKQTSIAKFMENNCK